MCAVLCGWQSWFVSAVRGKDCNSHSCITNCHPLFVLIRKWTARSVLMAMAPTNVASAPATLVAMVTTASATPQKLAVQNLTKNACEYLSYVFLQAKHFFGVIQWYFDCPWSWLWWGCGCASEHTIDVCWMENQGDLWSWDGLWFSAVTQQSRALAEDSVCAASVCVTLAMAATSVAVTTWPVTTLRMASVEVRIKILAETSFAHLFFSLEKWIIWLTSVY